MSGTRKNPSKLEEEEEGGLGMILCVILAGSGQVRLASREMSKDVKQSVVGSSPVDAGAEKKHDEN